MCSPKIQRLALKLSYFRSYGDVAFSSQKNINYLREYIALWELYVAKLQQLSALSVKFYLLSMLNIHHALGFLELSN